MQFSLIYRFIFSKMKAIPSPPERLDEIELVYEM